MIHMVVPSQKGDGSGGRPRNAMAQYYKAEFAASAAVHLAYRGSVSIWVLTSAIQPIILISVWRAVAGPNGEVSGYTAGRFVTYFGIMMLVEHMTYMWVMWEFERRIRQGTFSRLLLRPVHPIHKDVTDVASYRLIGLVGILPAMAIVMLLFGADTSGITPLTVIAFLPALALAMVLRFLVEWILALLAFWVTKTSALNNLYGSIREFLSGSFAPISVLPQLIGTVAFWSPFPWAQGFVVEVAMGSRTGPEVWVGYSIQLGWIVVALLVLRAVWPRAVRHYSAVGS